MILIFFCQPLPSVALSIWFATTVVANIGPGPGTGRYGLDFNCPDEGWEDLLYIQGWLNITSCQGHFWYLACEFWYYLAFPILAAFYAHNKMSGVILTICFISLSCVHNGLVTYITDGPILHNWKLANWAHGDYDNGTYISSQPPNFRKLDFDIAQS